MKAESIVYVIAGMCFGVILGWVIGTQQARRPAAVPAAAGRRAPQARPPATPPGAAARRGTRAGADDDHQERPEERRTPSFSSATPTSTPSAGTTRSSGTSGASSSIRRTPTRAPISASAYYYTNRTDEALAQFEQSLKIDPKHTKTLLNKGIVLAFGKQDLKAAAGGVEEGGRRWRPTVPKGRRHAARSKASRPPTPAAARRANQ